MLQCTPISYESEVTAVLERLRSHINLLNFLNSCLSKKLRQEEIDINIELFKDEGDRKSCDEYA